MADESVISGKVTKVIQYGQAPSVKVAVKVESSPAGAKYPVRFTAWDVGAAAKENDMIRLEGGAWSGKPTTYEKRDGTKGEGIDLALNGARLTVLGVSDAELPF